MKQKQSGVTCCSHYDDPLITGVSIVIADRAVVWYSSGHLATVNTHRYHRPRHELTSTRYRKQSKISLFAEADITGSVIGVLVLDKQFVT